MKKILFAIAMFVTVLTVNAQDLQSKAMSIKQKIENLPHKYTIEGTFIQYQKVFELNKGLTKDQIYDAVKRYVIKSYGDANSVIQVDDKVNGKIIVKGLFKRGTCGCGDIVFFGSGMEYQATHILQVDIKDDRVRVALSITKIQQKSGGTQYSPFKYIDFDATDFYPFTTECKVYSCNHMMNWYAKEGSPRQYKAEIHEGYVMYKIMLTANGVIDSIYKEITNPANVISVSDNW